MVENSCILEYVHKYINHVSSNLVKGIHWAIAFEEEAVCTFKCKQFTNTTDKDRIW